MEPEKRSMEEALFFVYDIFLLFINTNRCFSWCIAIVQNKIMTLLLVHTVLLMFFVLSSIVRANKT